MHSCRNLTLRLSLSSTLEAFAVTVHRLMGSDMLLLGLLAVVCQHITCRVSHPAVRVPEHGLVNPNDLTSPFAAGPVHRSCPAQVSGLTYRMQHTRPRCSSIFETRDCFAAALRLCICEVVKICVSKRSPACRQLFRQTALWIQSQAQGLAKGNKTCVCLHRLLRRQCRRLAWW